MKRRDLRLSAVVLALLLAGCAGAPREEGPSPEPVPTDPEPPPEEEAGEPEEETEPVELVFWLTPERTLALAAPSEGVVVEDFNFLGPGTLAGTRAPDPWVAVDPAPEHFLVTDARLELRYSSPVPQQAAMDAVGFGPVVTWYGEPDSHGSSTFHDAPTTLQPNEVARLSVPVALARNGVVHERGGTPSLLLVFLYAQNEGAPIHVHVGGEDGSRLVVTAVRYELPERLVASEERFEGEFVARQFLLPPTSEEETRRDFELPLDASVRKVVARLEGSGATSTDVDVNLFSPGGELVAAGSTPFATDALRAYEANLAGPGTYTLRVSIFDGARATFTLDVAVFREPVS